MGVVPLFGGSVAALSTLLLESSTLELESSLNRLSFGLRSKRSLADLFLPE